MGKDDADSNGLSDCSRDALEGDGPLRNTEIRLSIFDLDRTLTRRPTYSAFLLYAAARVAPWRLILVPMILGCMFAYKLGFLRRKQLKEIMQRAMLGARVHRTTVEALASEFAERQVRHNCYAEGIETIRRERSEGRVVVVATAAPRYYAEPMAILLEADAVVATASAWEDDWLLAGIDGENCYGPEKREMVKGWMESAYADQSIVHSRVFSDDVSDSPLFE